MQRRRPIGTAEDVKVDRLPLDPFGDGRALGEFCCHGHRTHADVGGAEVLAEGVYSPVIAATRLASSSARARCRCPGPARRRARP